MEVPLRDVDQLRPVSFEINYLQHAEGSALINMGNTRVLCSATVEERLPRWLHRSRLRHGWVTAEYAMLPRATKERTQRETRGARGRTQEIKRMIGRSLRSAVDLEQLGERQIIIDCDVIQADGGTRTAAITGGYVALALAIRKLYEAGKVPATTLQRGIAAVSVGILDGKAVLDLDYKMDQAVEVDFNVVMTDEGHFVEMQGTAEGRPYSRAALNAMLMLAELGIRELLTHQESALTSKGPDV